MRSVRGAFASFELCHMQTQVNCALIKQDEGNDGNFFVDCKFSLDFGVVMTFVSATFVGGLISIDYTKVSLTNWCRF